nr:molybdenum cofactor biosynthesis protein MoaB [Bacillus licheniformis]
MSVEEHKKEAPDCVNCKVITVSDTRTEDTDKSGRLMKEFLAEAGHEIVSYEIVKDEKEIIQKAVLKGCLDDRIDAVLLNGGTGIASRDVTIESIVPLFSKEIPGFGEIFRMLSYTEDIGAVPRSSQGSAAGVIQNKAVFATPGSSGAVKLAMSKLIVPELAHVIRELRKDMKK